MVRAIRGIPEVIALLDSDPENVIEFIDEAEGDLYSRVLSLAGRPSILVSVQRVGPSGEQMSLWGHTFMLAVQVKGDPHELFQTLMDGVTTASGFDGDPFLSLSLHPKYNPMNIPNWERRSIAVDEKTNFDYWELTTTYLSRGTE